MTTRVQWSIWIGPAWHPASSAYFYDWSGFAIGSSTNVNFSTTVASTLNAGATSLVLANADSFAAKGGVWIGPNGAGQAWEYCDYSGKSGNTLTGLVRESGSDREHSGIHTAGAPVRQWFELASNDGRLRMVRSLDDKLLASDWYAELSGIAAPQVALRPYHLAVLQTRSGASGSLSNYLVGFLGEATVRDDSQRVRRWSARLISVAGLLRLLQASGVRMGDFDAAQHATAESSTVLAAAHKERDSGDFVAAAPSFDAANVTDDEDTIWIADEMVGTPETPNPSYSGYTQLYLNPPASLNRGTRWVEIYNRNTAGSVLVAYNSANDTEWNLEIPAVDLTQDNGRMIIAESEAKFLEENPSQQATRIYSVEQSNDPSWFDHLQVAGGAVAFKFNSNYSAAVYWGNTTNSDTGWGADGWTGPSLPAPKPDETLRYLMLESGHADTRDFWQVGKNQSPGYTIKADGDDVWIALELPGMGLSLRDDVTAADPGLGQYLYINGQNGPSVDGLPSAGTLVIGDEQIDYMSKSAAGGYVVVGNRGANGTTAASHQAGDAVYLLVTQGGRTGVTDALPIKSTAWARQGGSIVPNSFVWRWSMLPARVPTDGRHENDYEAVQDVTGHTSSSHTANHMAGLRVKSILLEFRKMTTDPARPRLNRIRALVDPAFYDASQWLSSGQTVETLIRQVAVNAGLPAGALAVTAGGKTPTGFTTALDSAWAVMLSAAEIGGAWIDVRRNSTIGLAPDTFWSASVGGYTPVRTWSRANAAAVEFVRTGGGMASQIRVPWQTPDGTNRGTAEYPETPGELGAPQTMEQIYAADEAAATLYARKLYFMHRYPYEFAVTLAEGDITAEPRQVHRIDWSMDDSMQNLNRLILARQVEHTVEDTVLHTVVYGLQVDRESDG